MDPAGQWQIYRNIRPVWEDDFSSLPDTTLLVAHARSAFEDKDIVVENNMPFSDGKAVFVFNGELRGVKIKEEGRIGAEKIFNFIRRFDSGDPLAALKKGDGDHQEPDPVHPGHEHHHGEGSENLSLHLLPGGSGLLHHALQRERSARPLFGSFPF